MRIEDKEDLIDILDSDGLKVVLREIDAIVQAEERSVVSFVISDSNSINELLIRKARAEGARRLADAVRRRLDTIRPKKN